MNFHSQGPINLNKTEHFKLYKSGKLWLVAGLTAFSIMGGALVSQPAVQADTVVAAKATTSNATSQATSATATSTATASQAASATTNKAKTVQATSASATSAATTTSQAASAATSQAAPQAASAAVTSQAPSQAAKSATAKVAATKVETPKATSAASQAPAVSSAASSAAAKPAESTAPSKVDPQTKTDIWTIGDTTRPSVDAVDVASYQSGMTQKDFNTLKSLAVKTVVVKATEGKTYVNDAAVNQAKMANKAGLNVDFYHYATFNTASQAKSEATNMVTFLNTNKVSKKVLLFADMEASSTHTVNAEANLNAFWNTLDVAGYTNHGVYTSNTYLYRDAVIRTVGTSRVWRAQYPYSPASNKLWNTTDGAWQFSSTTHLPAGSDYTGYLDVSHNYNGLLEDSAGTETFEGNTAATTTTASADKVADSQKAYTTKSVKGTYKFTKTTAIKSAASTSAKTVGHYYKGNTVNYIAKLSNGTNTWLKYVSYDGSDHYVELPTVSQAKPAAKPATSTKTVTKNVTGWYTFNKSTAIKSAASDSAKTVGTYDKGNRVYYNAQVTKGGQTWLRYLSYGGAQHYVKISSVATTTKTNNSTKETIQAVKGTYKFSTATAIKSAASDSAKTVGTYYKGNTVNYNAKVTKNGQTWLRYLSYSGAQHYVKVGTASATTSTKATSNAKATVQAAKGTYKFPATTAIKSAASDSAATVGAYYKGNTVNYNAKVTSNGQTWLRYLSYSGAQHYVKVSGATTSTTVKNTSNVKNTAGRYTFKTTTNIRTAASLKASITGTYHAGESVYYIGTVSADGYQWLKYLANSGAYHFVAVVD